MFGVDFKNKFMTNEQLLICIASLIWHKAMGTAVATLIRFSTRMFFLTYSNIYN